MDDIGIGRERRRAVGSAPEPCRRLHKQQHQVAATLWVATWQASLPVPYRLYLPREWAEDRARKTKAGVPEEVKFQTKPEIALGQIRQALASDLPRGVVLADAG